MPRHSELRSAAPWIHLFAGLPTGSVAAGLDRIREAFCVRPLAEFVSDPSRRRGEVGVLLPPFVETSQLVEDWQASDFLSFRFGSGVALGKVVTLADTDFLADQLASSDPISAYGWGKTERDGRTVADIVAGGIESATHLVLVGSERSRAHVLPTLRVLNPTAERLAMGASTDAELLDFVTGPLERGEALVVPPWLELLRSDLRVSEIGDCFAYRCARPFDPERFGQWIEDPPEALVRGKGNVWLSNRPTQAFGYSCAGDVHRVFPAGRWWVGYPASHWPSDEAHRRRLLERWHPQFGDRRQELVFQGRGLDAAQVRAELDECLLSEEAALGSIVEESPVVSTPSYAAPTVELH
ncbi:MAG: hypothetical protein CL931_01165 [Deltaproteobacteria bacterium]|nr:hypothetical protein [Deltaproteobacteria bacterium]